VILILIYLLIMFEINKSGTNREKKKYITILYISK
jgi:hypothetical protein